MPDAPYQRLSAQDATFLDLESPERHQHIAAALVFEAPPERGRGEGVDIDRIREYVGSRLHRLPRYRQRLAHIPLENHPVWVDDAHFNLAYHVRHTGLPRPGDERQLKRLAGRLLGQQLDRERPLWELWVVEGLDGGERFAIIQKVHHCMVDGVSGVDLMALLMSDQPVETFPPGPDWEPVPAPDGLGLVRAELGRRLGEVSRAAFSAPRFLRDPSELVGRVREGVGSVAEALGAGLHGTSDTPINRPLGPHRRFDWLELDLARVKSVKDALGGTVNDVVLATVSGALRRFLELRRVHPEDLVLRANVPVSVRQQEESGSLGNRIALLMPELPVSEPDPLERLARVRRNMGELKESRQARGAEVLGAVSEWTSAALLSAAVKLSMAGRPYNLVVTNVPGPPIPLYLLGSRLAGCYPVVNLLERQGLGVALFSYAGRLFWGFTADWDQLPDLHEFVRAVRESFEELEARALLDAGAEASRGESAGAGSRAGTP